MRSRPSRPPVASLAVLVVTGALAAACGGATVGTSSPDHGHTAPNARRGRAAGAATRGTGAPTTAPAHATGGGSSGGTGSGTPGRTGGTESGSLGRTGGTGSGAASAATTGPTGPAGSTSGGASTPTTTGTPSGGTSSTGTLPVIAATTDGGFVSPDHEVACLLAINPSDQVRCVTFGVPTVVVLTPDGALQRCTGATCALGSRSPGYKVLAYGTSTGTDTFRCASATTGITCTVASSGKGFTASRTGVASVG